MGEAEASVARAIAVLQPALPLPVVFLGGLGVTYAARLGARWPGMKARGDGLSGALWLALRDGKRSARGSDIAR